MRESFQKHCSVLTSPFIMRKGLRTNQKCQTSGGHLDLQGRKVQLLELAQLMCSSQHDSNLLLRCGLDLASRPCSHAGPILESLASNEASETLL